MADLPRLLCHVCLAGSAGERPNGAGRATGALRPGGHEVSTPNATYSAPRGFFLHIPLFPVQTTSHRLLEQGLR